MTAKEKKQIIQELVNRIDAIGFRNFCQSNHTDGNLLPDIYETYRRVMGTHYKVGCKNCFLDCYMELSSLLKNQILENMENRIYELKKGVLLSGFAFNREGIDCIDRTITTELAEIHLTLDPSRIIYFQKFPENWQERIGLQEAKKETATSNEVITTKRTRKELLAEVKERGLGDKNTIKLTNLELQAIINANR